MFRPLRLFHKNTVNVVAVNTHSTKIIFSESYLDKAQRLKLWNLENKLLFGPIIEASKIKPSKLSKEKSTKGVKARIQRQHTEVLVPFSLISSPENLKKAAEKNAKTIIDSKLNDLISAQKIISRDIQLQIDNVSTDVPIKTHKIKGDNNPLLCSGLPLEMEIANCSNGLLSSTKNNVPSIIIRNLKMFPMLAYKQTTLADSEFTPEDKILRITPTPDKKNLPSVTKILEHTMSTEAKAHLEKWKQEKIDELGPEGFQKYQKSQLDTGAKYHDILSKYLVVPPPDLLTIDSNLKGLLTSVAYVLKSIKAPRAIESHVVHPVLKYQGVIDCIASYKNKPMLIEWKTSNKPKPTLSQTYDNPVQLAAYFGAISHDPNYKSLNVRDALLVIAYTDGSPADVHHLTTEKLRDHWAIWLARLETYMNTTENKAKKAEAAKTNNEDDKNSPKG